jgi:hypothetical protein
MRRSNTRLEPTTNRIIILATCAVMPAVRRGSTAIRWTALK